MARTCYFCGKSTQTGNKVSHSNRKSRRTWKPNLQSIKALIGTVTQKIDVCTKCLKKGKALKAA